ncbi:right-handed parallel beta-helix repeat-containing protein, partial [Candidatus Aenigmatarchaeota archaeon]
MKPTVANGVTFDCQGYSIECDTSSCIFGIQAGSDKTTITGCDVRYFNYGIWMTGSHNTVNNTICANNTWAGIDILGEATNNTIINSVFTHNKGTGMDGHGIFLTGNVTDNELNNVLSSHNNKGITIQSMSNNNMIRRSTIELNAEYGIRIDESQSNTIKHCFIENNPIGLVIDN